MRRWLSALGGIEGADAVSWTAFWVASAAALIGHLTTGGAVNASTGTRVGVVTLAVTASFAPLLMLRWAPLLRPERSRPWLILAAFALSAVIRGSMLSALLSALGAAEALWAYRISAAFQTHFLVLLGVALARSAIRAHARALEELAGVERRLVRAESEIIDDLTQRSSEAWARVDGRLRREVDALVAGDGPTAVRGLQHLGAEVVRPMSHTLALAVPPRPAPVVDEGERRITWGTAMAQVVDRPPLRPLAAAAVMLTTMLTAALGVFGLAEGLPLAVAMFACVYASSRAANAVLRCMAGSLAPHTRVGAVLLASLSVGYASVLIPSALLPPTESRATFAVGGGLYVAGIVVLLACVTAIRLRQDDVERQLEDSNDRLRRELVRLRQVQWLQRQRVARALHGPLQAAVTSAALRLDSAVRRGETDAALIDATRRDLLREIDVLSALEDEREPFGVALDRIRGTWRGLCDVRTDIPRDVDRMLAGDSICAAVMRDLVTEAVSNAVRHGGATRVWIRLHAPEDDLLTLAVVDDGRRAPTGSRAGLGKALLDACSLSWERSSDGSGCTLTAMIPVASASRAE